MRPPLLVLAISLALAQAANAAQSPGAAGQGRIEALEARIKALEANAEAMRQQAEAASAALEATRAEMEAMKTATETASSDAAAEDTGEPAPTAAPESANGNAFNPAINIVLNGSYTGHSLDPDAYQRSGFPLVGDGAPAAKGLSLGESEISFAANIDDKFYGQLTLAIGSDDGNTTLGVEEAFVDATTLPGGIALRVGRFFSNIGYLNSHHAHTDKFFDRPLPYQAFLGNQYGDDGVQLRWVAPTALFLEVGAELFRGQNYPSGGAANAGAGVRTLFAHAGGDVGNENEWLAGVSVLDSSSAGSDDGFFGDSRLYIPDATWKWAPEGNFKDGGVTVRGEYFLDDRDGDYVDPHQLLPNQAWKGKRRGAYVEGVYRINRRWEAGYRYDRLWADDSGPFASDFDPVRHSVMLSWLNSEFSLVRLQYSHDQPNNNDTDNAITLQYQMNLGAHGAHKF
ncbi:MAG: hypothetical protein H7147_05975 [Frankiaceae bacterium]|nr:hypothetical protein [Arenimonas sp.]